MKFDSSQALYGFIHNVMNVRNIAKALAGASDGWTLIATKGQITVTAHPNKGSVILTYKADGDTPAEVAKILIPLASNAEMEITADFGRGRLLEVRPHDTEEDVIRRYGGRRD